ncbi:8514_t:CDS:2 [Entrophospora sp. SA101]|nr:8514_t:CDS:2 [Entrophospora sp. SA101]
MLCYIFFNNTSVSTIYNKTKITDAFPEGLPYIKPKSLATSSGLKWQYQLDPYLKDTLQEQTEKHHFHFCNGFGAKEKNSKCLGFRCFILTYESPTPWEVLQLIARYEKKDMKQISVILVVDGLQNFVTTLDDGLNQDSAFYQTLIEIGNLALIISLQPPTTLQNDIVIPVFQQDNHIIKLLVDDCGGHGRALEVLAETLKDKNINECNIDNLMHHLCSNIIYHYEDAFNITALEIQTMDN